MTLGLMAVAFAALYLRFPIIERTDPWYAGSPACFRRVCRC